MAFQDLVELKKAQYPKGTNDRFATLDGYDRLLKGKIYDVLNYPFDQERENPDVPTSKYIRLRRRRPSVRYNIAKIITDQTSNLCFSQKHAPHVRVSGKDAEAEGDDLSIDPNQDFHTAIDNIVFATELDSVLLEAMREGSVGSVAIVMSVIGDDNAPWFDVYSGKFVTPQFDPRDPRKLTKLTQLYPTTGEELVAVGYSDEKYGTPDTLNQQYWMKIVLDEKSETYYLPMENERYQRMMSGQNELSDPSRKITWVIDEECTYDHPFGFTPAVWIRELGERRAIDGPCLYADIADIQIEIDYLLSQMGRGFKYTLDPLLVVKEGELQSYAPAGGFSQVPADSQATVKVNRNQLDRAVSVSKDGDAKLLEITGQGMNAAREHVKMLREYAMEVLGGMKSDQENTKGAQSGKALELLHQVLIWLAERLRIDYGIRGYLRLVRMLLTAITAGHVTVPGVDPGQIKLDMPLRLIWPEWWTPQGRDLFDHIMALETAAGGSAKAPIPIMPLEIVAREAAMILGLPDPTSIAAKVVKNYEKQSKAEELPFQLAAKAGKPDKDDDASSQAA